MSSPTPPRDRFERPFRIPRTVKRLFAKAPSPFVLTPVLKVVVAASAAFNPLQAAAGTLLHVMETVEVRCCFSSYPFNIS